MSTDNPEKVHDEMKALATTDTRQTGRELVFDPTTGKLVVTEKGQRPTPDAQIAGEIAKDGFFASY